MLIFILNVFLHIYIFAHSSLYGNGIKENSSSRICKCDFMRRKHVISGGVVNTGKDVTNSTKFRTFRLSVLHELIKQCPTHQGCNLHGQLANVEGTWQQINIITSTENKI